MHLTKVKIDHNKFPVTNCYPFNLEILNQISEINFPTPITFFTGENGCGKTTLLKAIAKCCGIHIWEYSERSRFRFNKFENYLYKFIDLQWNNGDVPGHYFDSRNFEYFTKLLDEWAIDDPEQLNYFGGKSLVAQSHGQSLMSFFNSRYQIKGIYFLDEPETALSPSTQIKLLELLSKISVNNLVQFIIATHSPIILALNGATIYNFDDKCFKKLRYKETSNYIVYKDFINNQ